MLSIENPPPDPPCPCEISQLRSSSDERASDKVALQEVDLLKSGLDEKNPVVLPKFSIRDYVFSSRSKDIKTNWPFSQKNLQFCVKHGVKELLPPFQSLDLVRNQSLKRGGAETSLTGRGTTETSLTDRGTTSSNLDGEPSRASDSFCPVSSNNSGCNTKPDIDCVNKIASITEGDKEFLSTTGSQSQSEIDLVPTERTPCSELETDCSFEAAVAAKPRALCAPVTLKNQTTAHPPVKKCKLTVKLGNTADPSSNEDSMSNCVTFMETMASKVCPVCRTFSSPSNTTLNAHIDQCLSVESTAKWTASPKVVKHRIKPRKTRLMVDIYETAPRCTLEELDRRNGRTWPTNSPLPTRGNEEHDEEKRQRAMPSPINVEEAGGEGAVYIDASGTKVRILSKFNESSQKPSCSNVVSRPGIGKFVNEGKRDKFPSVHKKNLHAQKSKKILKLAPQNKKFCSLKPNRSEICARLERNHAVEENREKEEHPGQPSSEAQLQIKRSDLGYMRKWVRSKRSGISKKSKCKRNLQLSGYSLRQNLLVESDHQPSLGDSPVERSFTLRTSNSSACSSSPESRKRLDDTSYEVAVSECNDQTPSRKRIGFSSFGSSSSGNVERSPKSKLRTKPLSKDSASVRESCKDRSRENSSSRGCKWVDVNARVIDKSDGSPVLSESFRTTRAVSSKATRLSSLRKRLSVKQQSKSESKIGFDRKSSAPRKARMDWTTELNEQLEVRPSEVVEQHDQSLQNHVKHRSRVEEETDQASLRRHSVSEIRNKGGSIGNSQREEALSLTSSYLECRRYGLDEEENMDPSVRSGGNLVATCNDVETAGKGVPSNGEMMNTMNLNESSDPEFQELSVPSYTRTKSLRYAEVLKGSFYGPTEPSLGDEEEMFGADEVCNDVISRNTHMGAELDSRVRHEKYFSEVDQIPIPGPPGSFLPSPGGMSSENHQGNSSLTTNQLQSSEEHNDLVDKDSSNSPISATSTISSSAMFRSDSKSSEPLSVGSHGVQDEIRSGFSDTCHDPVVENTARTPYKGSIGAQKGNPDELKVNTIFPGKGLLNFNDGQPCYCVRKEGISQGLTLNYEESQLLRRRTMSSVTFPANGNQMNCDLNKGILSMNSKPEAFTRNDFVSSGSEKTVPPYRVSADSALSNRGDHESASPSTSNPVLRLMGKNLMVVNKDEDASLKPRGTHSNMPHNHANLLYQTGFRSFNGGILYGDFNSHNQMVVQGPSISGQNQENIMGLDFNTKLSNSFNSHVNPGTPQTFKAMFPRTNMGGGFTAPMEPHESKGLYNPNNMWTYKMEKIQATPDPHHQNADYTANHMKEIIVIDDSPETESNFASEAARSHGMKEIPVTSSGIAIPLVSNYSARQVNPFYGGSPMMQNASFEMPPPRGANASPLKWSCSSSGSSVLHPSSLMASSSSTGHPRPSVYYSPSFS